MNYLSLYEVLCLSVYPRLFTPSFSLLVISLPSPHLPVRSLFDYTPAYMLFQSASSCRLPRKAAPSFQLYVLPSGLAFVQAPVCLSACLPVCLPASLPACLRLSVRLSVACLTAAFSSPVLNVCRLSVNLSCFLGDPGPLSV